MTEIESLFTEEQYKKHFRFLTKEIVEEKLRDIRDEPNLYGKRHQLTNTDTLDKKYKEYLEESKEIYDLQISIFSHPLSKLCLNIMNPSHKAIQYSPILPENPDPNTFYITLDTLKSDGIQHTDSFLGIPGDYFYIGSIEDSTDSGVFLHENRDVIYSYAFPSQNYRLQSNFCSQTWSTKIFKTHLKPEEGEYKKIEGSVVITRNSDFSEIVQKEHQPGLPTFTLLRRTTEDKNTHTYGDFIFSEDHSSLYCQRVVQIYFQDLEATKRLEKHVGEYIQDFLSSAYMLLYSGNEESLIKYEKTDPNTITKWIVYLRHQVDRTYELSPAEFDRLGLGEIKNNSIGNLKQFKYFVSKELPQKTGGNFSTKLLLLHNSISIEYLTYGEITQFPYKKISSIDVQPPEEQLDLEKIKEHAKEILEGYSDNQIIGLRARGLKVDDRGEEGVAIYEGQFVGPEMKGYGHYRIEGQLDFVGKVADNKPLEGTMTYPGDYKFIGKFLEYNLHDENGRIEIPGMFEYEGNVEGSFPHGEGKMTFLKSGKTYEGGFVKGSFEGSGKLLFEKGDFISGEFKDNVADGEGELVRVTGDVYSGRIKQESKLATEVEIEGKLLRADGGVEEGVFQVDLAESEDGSGGVGGSGGGSGGGPSESEGGDASGTLKMIGLRELGYFGLFSWPVLGRFSSLPIHGFLVQEKERLDYLLYQDALAQFESRVKMRTSGLFSKNLESASFSLAQKLGSKRNESIATRRINLLGSNLWKQKFLPKSFTFFRLAKKVF